MMTINWSIVFVLILISIPGLMIYIPRLVDALLKDQSADLKKRMVRIISIHSFIMVFIMGVAGSLLAQKTKVDSPVLDTLLRGQASDDSIIMNLIQSLLVTGIGLIGYIQLERLTTQRFIKPPEQKIISKLWSIIRLDGAVFYHGVMDEIIGRFGLINVVLYFMLLISPELTTFQIGLAVVMSSLIFSASKLPIYISLGCRSSRSFLGTLLLQHFYLSILFSIIYVNYGLIFSILTHMLFYVGLWQFHSPVKEVQ